MDKQDRSPNYPAYGLAAAIRYVESLYNAEKRSTVPLESVSRAIGGSEKLGGTSRSKIGAMRQFGLIEGRGKVRISDLALAIILKPSNEQYASSIRTAAWTPELFRELREEYNDASDETLRYHLIRNKGFSDEGARRTVKTYRETVDFVSSTVGLLPEGGDNMPQDKIVISPTQVRSSVPSMDLPTSSATPFNLSSVNYSLVLRPEATDDDIDDLIFNLERRKKHLTKTGKSVEKKSDKGPTD